jgi:hypothetical protein
LGFVVLTVSPASAAPPPPPPPPPPSTAGRIQEDRSTKFKKD